MSSLVTIHIPTYRQADVIGRAVESALAQTYLNVEVVISDDASPDDTPAAVAAYVADPRVRYHRNPHNLGRVANYHQGLHHLARGEWYLNLDGDDWLCDADFISRALAKLAQVPRPSEVAAITAGCAQSTGGAGSAPLLDHKVARLVPSKEAFLRFGISSEFWLPHVSTLVRRSLGIRAGMYDLDILSADLESLRRLVLEGPVLALPGIVAVWNQHDSSASKAPGLAALLRNYRSFERPLKVARRRSVVSRSEASSWSRDSLKCYLANLQFYAAQGGEAWSAWRLRLVSYFALHHRPMLPVLLKVLLWQTVHSRMRG